MADNIHILVAVEVRLYREGLADLLSREPGFRVVGTADRPHDVLDRARALMPHVVLLDCGLASSLSIVREIQQSSPRLRVVALGLGESDPEVLSYAQAGMSGYVSRDGTSAQLFAAIRGAASGEFLCSPHVASILLQRVAATAPPALRAADGLTRREQEILSLLGEDLSNKAIANRLHIEISTVKNHVHHILEKLHVRHRRQVASRLRHLAPEGSGSQDPYAAQKN